MVTTQTIDTNLPKRYRSHSPVKVKPNSKSKEVTKSKKAITDAKKEVLKMDKPLNNISLSEQYLIMVKRFGVYRRKNHLSSEAMELMVWVYLVYRDTCKGVTSYGIAKEYNVYAGELQNCRNKLNKLVDKGYLLKAGYSLNRSVIYIPSLKTIEDLKELVS